MTKEDMKKYLILAILALLFVIIGCVGLIIFGDLYSRLSFLMVVIGLTNTIDILVHQGHRIRTANRVKVTKLKSPQ